MKTVVHILRSVLLSLELLAAAMLVLIYVFIPAPFERLDEVLLEINSAYILTPVSGLLLFAAGLCWKILYPTTGSEELVKWPMYSKLRITTLIGLLFIVLGEGCTLVGVIGRGHFPHGIDSLIILIGYSISGISAFTMLLAALIVRAILMGGD